MKSLLYECCRKTRGSYPAIITCFRGASAGASAGLPPASAELPRGKKSQHVLGVLIIFANLVKDVSSDFMIVFDNLKDVSIGFAEKEADGRRERNLEQ